MTLHAVHSDNQSLLSYLSQITPFLEQPDVTEFCINRPGEAFIERSDGWTREELPFATDFWCRAFASLLGDTSQALSEQTPIMSAMIGGHYRVQIVMPPVAEHVSITIRRPSSLVKPLATFAAEGLFADCRRADDKPDSENQALARMLKDGDYPAFLQGAVIAKKNIIVSGPTGSGKTTFTKGLILAIPSYERLISIEDARELNLDQHPNHVRLLYAKDGGGVTPKQLLESCLRMRPDRILQAELRGDETYHYLRAIFGHPGAITSVHAPTAVLAFEQLMLLVKESPAGRELSREDITTLLRMAVDVVVQFGFVRQQRYIKEIYFSRGGE